MKKVLTSLLVVFTSLVTHSHLQAQAICFGPKISHTVNEHPGAFCSGDFNGDTKTDLAVSYLNSDSISILFGNGLGSFTAVVSFEVGYNPVSICSADFNGDGKADLATYNSGPGTVSVLMGNGAGSFSTAAGLSTSFYNPNSTICAANLNGDSNADLVISSGFNFVLVALSNGNGSFASPVQVTADAGTSKVISADFNGDAHADLAVTDFNVTANVSILLGNGTGGFGAAAVYTLAGNPQSLVSGDFNNDNKMDLAVANRGNNITGYVSVLSGDGAGGFSAAVDYSLGLATVPQAVSAADFDGDGKLDIAAAAVAGTYTSVVAVLKSNSLGSFFSAINFAVDSFPVAILNADLNNDGKMDLASLAAYNGNPLTGNVSVLINCRVTALPEHDADNNSILIYPNPAPAGSSISIEAPLGEKRSVQVYDVSGRLLLSQVISGTASIDAGELADGLYTVSISGAGGTLAKKLLVLK